MRILNKHKKLITTHRRRFTLYIMIHSQHMKIWKYQFNQITIQWRLSRKDIEYHCDWNVSNKIQIKHKKLITRSMNNTNNDHDRTMTIYIEFWVSFCLPTWSKSWTVNFTVKIWTYIYSVGGLSSNTIEYKNSLSLLIINQIDTRTHKLEVNKD